VKLRFRDSLNPLNTKLNPICHLLALLGVNYFLHVSRIRVNILVYVQQDAKLHSLFYLETALRVSGGTSTHHQERKQLTLQHLVFVTQLLLSAAVNILIYIQKDATLHSLLYLETALHISGGTSAHHQERKQLYIQHLLFVTPLLLPVAIAAGSSNGVTNTRCCRYSCLRSC
jgi:hypothetical protein